MDDETAIEQNRRAWNETAAIHERASMAALLEAIARGGFSTLDATEKRVFADLGAADGLAVAQLCCNNARELLSLKLAGAGRCTGFDVSDAFIAQGVRLAAAANVELELVRTSIYDIASTSDGAYDIVYVTVGALGWLPDLRAFFATVARILRPGGVLFIYEMHPLLDMLDPEAGLALKRSYFTSEPMVEAGAPDYLDPTQQVSEASYWFHHTLSEIMSGCLQSGLAIERFEEHAHDVSMVFASLAPLGMLPLSYVLLARRSR